ncbi:MAG TPA: SulP family inorganic anion transporter [Dinghuibacter sp.]|uniref:SulP family inorganic anion transporter n=1 Tax=Dinghuibacter sp. TaxID=2024697 RepID=UPI002C783A80|nr:SulP family inorganic anion transporter [Dinghuibacter sp.]HTJ14345.1 SulP family inorganic anion transporter [Dinghuibacter sp.]
MFKPKLFDTLKDYDRQQLVKDLQAGLIVGLVALPLAIAFGIASGVAPEKGLFTAVIAGFVISALGGSRVQIGGPTGAFIVIVYGIVQTYGVGGLVIATFMAGVLLIGMGIARLGSVIKFIPYPLIVGFTSGIAVVIFSSQVKDLLGLHMGAVPADFPAKWKTYAHYFPTSNLYAALIAGGTIALILVWPKVSKRVPGSLVAVLLTTLLAYLLHLPVETVGSRFGKIQSSLPHPYIPSLDFHTIKTLIQPAITIALLGGIESLLSAVVADGMIGGNHRSNMELVAQGAANICSSIFGGIPATGAIARTATNVKNGGRTPIAGMTHAVTLLLILLFFGKWAALIPMATLAGVLVVVCYNMSEWRSFVSILKGPKYDIAILLTTFFLTVVVDLTTAIEIGMILAAFLFMRGMIRSSSVETMTDNVNSDDTGKIEVPKGVEVFEITGPLFFGAAYKFQDALRLADRHPRVLIVRLRKVPLMDATGIRVIKEVVQQSRRRGTRLILSEIHNAQILKDLTDARLVFAIGKANVTATLRDAIRRSHILLEQE